MKILFNPECSKCKIAEKFLIDKNKKFDKILYLNSKLSEKEITSIINKGISLKNLIREKEPEYISLINGKNLSDEEIISILSNNPILIQRPIAILKDKAVIIRDKESLNTLISLNQND